jgi:hypothetical protein
MHRETSASQRFGMGFERRELTRCDHHAHTALGQPGGERSTESVAAASNQSCL